MLACGVFKVIKVEFSGIGAVVLGKIGEWLFEVGGIEEKTELSVWGESEGDTTGVVVGTLILLSIIIKVFLRNLVALKKMMVLMKPLN